MAELKTTKVQDIAWHYVTTYWDRLHPEERLIFLTNVLTEREWKQLQDRMLHKEREG